MGGDTPFKEVDIAKKKKSNLDGLGDIPSESNPRGREAYFYHLRSMIVEHEQRRYKEDMILRALYRRLHDFDNDSVSAYYFRTGDTVCVGCETAVGQEGESSDPKHNHIDKTGANVSCKPRCISSYNCSICNKALNPVCGDCELKINDPRIVDNEHLQEGATLPEAANDLLTVEADRLEVFMNKLRAIDEQKQLKLSQSECSTNTHDNLKGTIKELFNNSQLLVNKTKLEQDSKVYINANTTNNKLSNLFRSSTSQAKRRTSVLEIMSSPEEKVLKKPHTNSSTICDAIEIKDFPFAPEEPPVKRSNTTNHPSLHQLTVNNELSSNFSPLVPNGEVYINSLILSDDDEESPKEEERLKKTLALPTHEPTSDFEDDYAINAKSLRSSFVKPSDICTSTNDTDVAHPSVTHTNTYHPTIANSNNNHTHHNTTSAPTNNETTTACHENGANDAASRRPNSSEHASHVLTLRVNGLIGSSTFAQRVEERPLQLWNPFTKKAASLKNELQFPDSTFPKGASAKKPQGALLHGDMVRDYTCAMFHAQDSYEVVTDIHIPNGSALDRFQVFAKESNLPPGLLFMSLMRRLSLKGDLKNTKGAVLTELSSHFGIKANPQSGEHLSAIAIYLATGQFSSESLASAANLKFNSLKDVEKVFDSKKFTETIKKPATAQTTKTKQKTTIKLTTRSVTNNNNASTDPNESAAQLSAFGFNKFSAVVEQWKQQDSEEENDDEQNTTFTNVSKNIAITKLSSVAKPNALSIAEHNANNESVRRYGNLNHSIVREASPTGNQTYVSDMFEPVSVMAKPLTIASPLRNCFNFNDDLVTEHHASHGPTQVAGSALLKSKLALAESAGNVNTLQKTNSGGMCPIFQRNYRPAPPTPTKEKTKEKKIAAEQVYEHICASLVETVRNSASIKDDPLYSQKLQIMNSIMLMQVVDITDVKALFPHIPTAYILQDFEKHNVLLRKSKQ